MNPAFGMAVIAFGLLAAGPAGAQSAPTELALNETLEWNGTDNGRQFRFGAVNMTLGIVPGGEDWVEGATLQVTRPDTEPLTIETVAGLSGSGQIGVYQMGGGATLVFGSYSGGAHCCQVLILLELDSPDAVPVEAGWYDGGTIVPQDVDGDGIYEIVVPDGRFNYAFDSYATSFPPLIVFGLRDGELTDISDTTKFRRLFAVEFAALAENCGTSNDWLAGACAGLLATAARLEIYAPIRAMLGDGLASRVVSRWDSFEFCLDENCEEKQSFTDLDAAIEHALRAWGYLD